MDVKNRFEKSKLAEKGFWENFEKSTNGQQLTLTEYSIKVNWKVNGIIFPLKSEMNLGRIQVKAK